MVQGPVLNLRRVPKAPYPPDSARIPFPALHLPFFQLPLQTELPGDVILRPLCHPASLQL